MTIRTHRFAIGAVTAAVALSTITPVAAHAAPAARTTVATSAFVPVAFTAFTPTTIGSVTDGAVYVGGTDATGRARVRLVERRGAATTQREVTLPVAQGTVRIATGRSAAFATVGNRLFRLVGTTAREIAVPATTPAGAKFTLETFAVDGAKSIFIGGQQAIGPGAGPYSQAAHWDGAAWTWLPQGGAMEGYQRSYALGGHFYGIYLPGLAPGQIHAAKEWTGTQWSSLGNTGYNYAGAINYADAWTFVSTNDITRWGYASPMPATTANPMRGTCSHVVDGAATTCPAPTWGVSAAVRLADGSVVLGGMDALASPGGFARVATPGAQPVALGGDNGDTVTALAAAATGSTVWALTKTGTTTTLQIMAPAKRQGPPAPQPPKRHVPRHH